MGTRFDKARFHIDAGPASLFERIRFKLAAPRRLEIHAQHFRERAAEREIPVEALTRFDPSSWRLMTAEVRTDNGKFINSAWTLEIDGDRWWVVIGFGDVIETAFCSKKHGLGPFIVTNGPLFEFVERVNLALMETEPSP